MTIGTTEKDLDAACRLTEKSASCVDLVLEQVHEDEARGVGDRLAVELVAEVAVDQRDEQQQREAEAERQDHHRGRGAGAVDRLDARCGARAFGSGGTRRSSAAAARRRRAG